MGRRTHARGTGTLTNQIQALFALSQAQELTLEAHRALGASRDVEWVSTSATLYLERVADLVTRVDEVYQDLARLQELHRQFLNTITYECQAVW